MIFVTVGTSKQDFSRLIREIDKLINEKVINDEVVVQSNLCMYKPKNFVINSQLSKREYQLYLKKCDLIITHGGVGSIMDGLKNNKKVIAFPRLAKYSEAVNDHQVEIINEFKKMNYILTGKISDLDKILEDVKSFVPNTYKSNNKLFNNLVLEEIYRDY